MDHALDQSSRPNPIERENSKESHRELRSNNWSAFFSTVGPHRATFGRLCAAMVIFVQIDIPTIARADVVLDYRCQALWDIKDTEEKDSAFRGFCALIEANPSGLQNVLKH
jgi:hypothetical protein